LTISQILEKNLPYDTQTAFAPIGLALTYCNALVSRPDFAASSVPQFARSRERKTRLH
jgi:tripartite-type tricarboxylate transporter receptor subunit TctC